MPAKQATLWMAPALPVFAAAAAPTGVVLTRSQRSACGSGYAREAGDAEDGTGFAGVRGRGRSHRCRVSSKPAQYLWERACPRSRRRYGWHRLCRCSRACPDASQSSDLGLLRSPSLASQAPTGTAQASRLSRSLWEPGLPAMGCAAAPMTSGLSASAWAPPPLGNRPGSRSRNLRQPASHGPGTAWRNHH